MNNYHVLIVYRNFHAKSGHASHVGLGVNAMLTARVLRQNGILADPVGVWTPADVAAALDRAPYTHCVVEALWIPTADMQMLLNRFPRVEFVSRCHSQIAFLQVEPGAISLLRQAAVLEGGNLNFHVSANNARFSDFFQKTYHFPCITLPNLYDVTEHDRYRHHSPSHILRLGSFGALRLMKNHTTAAAAALLIGRRRRANIEFHISVNREEAPGAKGVLASLRNMFSGLTWAKLVEVPWAPWPEFRRIIGQMDLCLQLSHSETFNIVTADAASEYIPSVVSDAIDWAPSYWFADVDCAESAARTGDHILSDPHAGKDGHQALTKYVAHAVREWKHWLNESAKGSALTLPTLTL